jgi:hypothetical protein
MIYGSTFVSAEIHFRTANTLAKGSAGFQSSVFGVPLVLCGSALKSELSRTSQRSRCIPALRWT